MKDYKSDAIESLLDYNLLCCAEKNISDRLKDIETLIATIRTTESASDAPPSTAQLPEFDEYNILKARLSSCRTNRAAIERGLSMLNDREFTVLDRLYLHRNREDDAMFELMDLLSCEKTQLYRIRARALKKFFVAMNGPINEADKYRQPS